MCFAAKLVCIYMRREPTYTLLVVFAQYEPNLSDALAPPSSRHNRCSPLTPSWAELTAPPKGLRECLRELNTKWKFIECRWLWFRLRRRFFQNNKLPVTERKGHHGTSENFDSRMLISSRVYFIFSATSPHQIVCYSAVLTLSLLRFPGYRCLHSDDRRRWLPASTTCNFVLVGRGQQRVWTVWEPLFSEHECKMWRETACWQVVEHGRDTPDMWERESWRNDIINISTWILFYFITPA